MLRERDLKMKNGRTLYEENDEKSSSFMMALGMAISVFPSLVSRAEEEEGIAVNRSMLYSDTSKLQNLQDLGFNETVLSNCYDADVQYGKKGKF